MSKSTFSDKCACLGELWCFYREDAETDPTWSDYFAWADVSLPLAFAIWRNMATIKSGEDGDRAKEYVDEAFAMLCEILDVDAQGKYENLGQLFQASPNPPMETVTSMPESSLTLAVINKGNDEG